MKLKLLAFKIKIYKNQNIMYLPKYQRHRYKIIMISFNSQKSFIIMIIMTLLNFKRALTVHYSIVQDCTSPLTQPRSEPVRPLHCQVHTLWGEECSVSTNTTTSCVKLYLSRVGRGKRGLEWGDSGEASGVL